MEVTDICGSFMEDFDEFIVSTFGISFELIFRNSHQLRSQIEFIKAPCVVANGSISALTHVAQDIGDCLFDVLCYIINREKRIDFAEIHFNSQIDDSHWRAFSSAWMTVRISSRFV